jgi:hypothetical protein
MLNAHPNAAIAHEPNVGRLILDGCTREAAFARILARAWWFDLRGNATNYSYDIPGQWQGLFDRVQVVGDKCGDWVSRCIEENPGFLDRVLATVEVPVRLIHVVRNPYDNIAAISIWHSLTLDEGADFSFAHCRTNAGIEELGDRARRSPLGTRSCSWRSLNRLRRRRRRPSRPARTPRPSSRARRSRGSRP